jgi:hypothetical protein
MFEILLGLIGSALMVVLGRVAFFKPLRLAGYDGSLRELKQRIRHMKIAGVLLMISGSAMFVQCIFHIGSLLFHK